MVVKKQLKLVTIDEEKKKPKIIVQDIKLSEDYYRVTQLILNNKDRYYINWNTKEDFKKGFSRLQRHYKFKQEDVIDISTKTHRYKSTSFTAPGFKP